MARTACASHWPAPATRVSAACSSMLSCASSTAAMPPWAQALAHSSAAPLLSRATRRCGGSDRAAAMPARPAPMMSTSVQGCVMALSSGGTEMLEERCIARKVAAGAHGLAVAGRESQHAFDGAARGLGDGGVHLDGAQALLQGQLHALQAVHRHPGAHGAALAGGALAGRGRGQEGLARVAHAHVVQEIGR